MDLYRKFKWTIHDISQLDCNTMHSELFSFCNHEWRLLFLPKWSDSQVMLVVSYHGDLTKLNEDWSKVCHFKLDFINQAGVIKNAENQCQFNAALPAFFYPLSLDETCSSSSRGNILRGNCTVVIEILIRESNRELDDAIKLTNTFNECVDFRDFGKVTNGFVPLLEEVLDSNPLFVQQIKRRIPRTVSCALDALGAICIS